MFVPWPASSNCAKMYFSVLYAMLTAHRQRREALADQVLGKAPSQGWSPGDRDPARIVRNLNPSDSGLFVAYNTALSRPILRTIRLVRNELYAGVGLRGLQLEQIGRAHV